jgi:hypothetical protein
VSGEHGLELLVLLCHLGGRKDIALPESLAHSGANHLRRPNGQQRDSVILSIIEQEWPEARAPLRRTLSAYGS